MSDSGPDTTGSGGEVRGREILPVNIEDELRQSYLDYAMSVIVGRALPDVRDGLKPVHKRVLFAMNEMNNTYNRPYMKSARVSGEVMGKYHPHGEGGHLRHDRPHGAGLFPCATSSSTAQGNFGSIDGDPPAAGPGTPRSAWPSSLPNCWPISIWTPWTSSPNYDETLTMPEVLPTPRPQPVAERRFRYRRRSRNEYSATQTCAK